MLQEFSVTNFLSFEKRETINFLATKDKTNLDELTYEVKKGIRILRVAAIYGANASGKSNLLIAIESMWRLLYSTQTLSSNPIPHHKPFIFNTDKPTEFNAIFWVGENKHTYKISFNRNQVLYEKIEYTSTNGIISLLYERDLEGIRFGTTLKFSKRDQNELIKETLSNHTVLSTLNKKNLNVPAEIRNLFNWIENYVHEVDVHDDHIKIAEQAEKEPKLKALILDLLRKADFNIADFNLIGMEVPKDVAQMILNDENLSEISKERLLSDRKDILFSHIAGKRKFQIVYGRQSTGTKIFFRLARLLYELGYKGSVIMLDEIEDSLHYDLLLHFFQIFLQTNTRSQLIFTTHNQLLLDENWMIRRDMLWFIEKDIDTAASYLYRASNLGIHKNLSLINAYKVGKMGAKPNLGSTFIE